MNICDYNKYIYVKTCVQASFDMYELYNFSSQKHYKKNFHSVGNR